MEVMVGVESEYIPDSSLREVGADRFEHKAIASELANIVQTVATPYAIAVFAPWGSGKTSLGWLLRGALRGTECRFVAFDAWKYADEPLRRHFITEVADELGRICGHGSTGRNEKWL